MNDQLQSKKSNEAEESYLHYYKLGLNLSKQGKLIEAIEAFEEAIKLNPDYVWSYYDLGLTQSAAGYFADAEKAFRKAIELNPDYVWTYFQLGEIYSAIGNFTESVKAYKKAIELKPDHDWSYHQLGNTLSKKGNFTEAIKAYEKAIYLKPDYPESYNNLGDVFSKQGQIDRAKDCFQMALKYKLKTKKVNIMTSEQPSEPNFMIIGFAKCGTTSLYEYIIQHPQILPAAKKEIMYFSEYFHYGLDWYKSHFSSIADGKHMLTGEASAHYIDHPESCERIYKSYPNLKFIVILRNPVKRTYSDYQMWKREGKEKRTFEDILNAEMKRIKGEAQATFSVKSGSAYPSYIASSLYICSLKRWMTLFPREQFLILQTEELYANPDDVLNKIFHFLVVDDYKIESYSKHNVGSYTRMGEDIQNRLKAYFQPHNQLLEEFLGIKFNW